MSRMYDIAVFNAASLSGETLLSVLAESEVKSGVIYPLAEEVGPDAVVEFKGVELDVLAASTFNFADADVFFVPAGCDINPEIIHLAKESGCCVINASGAATGPIILPGMNENLLSEAWEGYEVAIPSSPAVLLLQALKPLQEEVGIDSVNLVASISVSSHGKAGFEELRSQTVELLSGKPVQSKLFEQRIAFNMIPKIGALDENGSTEIESHLSDELVKGLGQDDLRVSVTCIQAPTFFGDSLAVHLDLDRPIDVDAVRELLGAVASVDLYSADEVPTVESAAGNDQLLVGRIRQNASHADQLSLWIVADSLRYCAIQSVAVAEILLKDFPDYHLT